MAAPRVSFFPRFTAPVPHTNGNGSKAPPDGQKALTISPFALTQFVPIDSAGHTVDVAGETGWYAASWLAYACMRYRATKLVEAPLWIAEEEDGEESWVEGDHPLAELLERPNPDMEMSDLLEFTSLYLDSAGSALWVKSRDRGNRVGALYPFSGDDFSVESFDGRLFGRFRVRTSTGERIYGPDDVVFFRNASLTDPHGATSPLHAALARLGVDRTLVRAIVAGLQNGIVPSASLRFPPDMVLTKDQAEDLRANVPPQYAEARNHGKLFISNGELVPHQMGFEGLNGGELAKEIEAAVCACFQCPPAVIGAYVGLENSSDRHNMEAAISMFYDNAILPTWARAEKALTRQLLREVDDNPLRFIRFDKSKIKALQTDRAGASDVIQKAGRALTVNDARAMLGLALLDEKDPRGEELMSQPAPAFAPPATPEAPKADPALIERKARDDTRWTVWDAVTRSHEYGWEKAAAAQLEEDRAAILALFDRAKSAAGPTERKDDDQADQAFVRDLVERVAEHMNMTAKGRWAERIRPLSEATSRAAVQRAAVELGISFDLLQPGLIQYVEKHAALLVTQVTDTTKLAIRDALAAGLVEGESIPKMAERIRDSGAFSRSRAELIARTETTTNSNGAAVESLRSYSRETGDRFRKRWLSARDERVRDEHRDLDGETVDLDEPFSNGLMQPGEPNCRCTTLMEMVDAPKADPMVVALMDTARAVVELTQKETPAPVFNLSLTTEAPKAGGTKTLTVRRNEQGALVGADITEGAN